MLRYKINKISEVQTDQLLDFYKKIYHKRYKSLAYNWRWWYRVGYNKFEPLILSVENKIIGQAGLLPIDLSIMENKVPAIWFVDFAILSEFQGKGYGKILTREWMKICPNQITFCNNLSLRVFKKFGWENNQSANRFAKPINTLKFLPVIKRLKLNFINKTLRYFIEKKYKRDILIHPYRINDNFKIINESFKIKKISKEKEFAKIVRDESWLHWRLMECPYKKDIFFFEYKNNFAIVHIFLKENIKRLNILYSYYTDNPQESELFNLIINWAIKNNVDLVWAINRNKKYENIFPRLLIKPMNFAFWSSDTKIFKVLQNGLLNPQGIDSDNDSSLYVE